MNFSVVYFVWTMDVLNRSFCFFFFFFPPFSSEREQTKVSASLRWKLTQRKKNNNVTCRPGSTTGCGGAAGPLSSCRSAFSKAWLNEFWKLGTGTLSDPSLSPSLSAAGGASSLSAQDKTQSWVQEAFGVLHCITYTDWFYRKWKIKTEG